MIVPPFTMVADVERERRDSTPLKPSAFEQLTLSRK